MNLSTAFGSIARSLLQVLCLLVQMITAIPCFGKQFAMAGDAPWVNSSKMQRFYKKDGTWWGYEIFLYFLSGVLQQLCRAVALCNVVLPEIQTPGDNGRSSVWCAEGLDVYVGDSQHQRARRPHGAELRPLPVLQHRVQRLDALRVHLPQPLSEPHRLPQPLHALGIAEVHQGQALQVVENLHRDAVLQESTDGAAQTVTAPNGTARHSTAPGAA